MYTIEIVCENSFDDALLMEYSGGFVTLFQKGLEDQNIKVKVSAFKTLTIFLSSIQKLELVMKFSEVLNMLLEKAIELIKFDQDSGIVALESLNELMDTHPKFVKPILT
jgi:importin-5